MLELKYSLVIEATDDPNFFGFYSPDLEGFTGIGHSVEDCLYQAKWGMKEHVETLVEQLAIDCLPDPAVLLGRDRFGERDDEPDAAVGLDGHEGAPAAA